MAISKAKKTRMKHVREGGADPTIHRSVFATIDLRTQRTKTKQEKVNQKKYKQSYSAVGKECLYFLYLLILDSHPLFLPHDLLNLIHVHHA
ncbi:hypothetical protein DFP96_101577 [Listeria rocourtiae]|uniref:Uncharacterized protein n=1 Tax=Listeria rocourtiae TaxID=647910 RepID=A0A4R6ZTQ8_9LIST|nr:hypothetical protein DFP96_101577 [Listeria rocourtiae]